MMHVTAPLLCVLLIAQSASADPILVNVSSVHALDPGDLIASVGGPSRVGHYDDGSPAIVSSLGSFIGHWFSHVYRHEDRYTYLYGIEAAVCLDCGRGYYNAGQSTLLEGEFSGYRPEGQWGRAGWNFAPRGLTAQGFTFTGYDAAVFYLLSTMPPALTGLMSGHFEISNGYSHEDPLWGPNLFFTASMPVYVPEQIAYAPTDLNPVPEPGTLALVLVGLWSVIRRCRRARSQ